MAKRGIAKTHEFVKIVASCNGEEFELENIVGIFSAVSTECDLCGSHGEVKASVKCPYCGKYVYIILDSW